MDRDLTQFDRPGDGQPAGRVVAAGQHVGHGVARLGAEKPAGERGGGPLVEPRGQDGASGGEQDDHGLAEDEDGTGELGLESRQVALETPWLRWLQLAEPVEVRIDGVRGEGVILKTVVERAVPHSLGPG